MAPLRFLTSGESHGPTLTAILEGMPAGLPLSADDINPDLARRQGLNRDGKPYPGASPRMKLDRAKWKGKAVEPMTIPRPGHADLTSAVKYGFSDLRMSLERASARGTAAREI